jgi:hypothetical protein
LKIYHVSLYHEVEKVCITSIEVPKTIFNSPFDSSHKGNKSDAASFEMCSLVKDEICVYKINKIYNKHLIMNVSLRNL